MTAAIPTIRLASTGSTNVEAKVRAEAGERGPLWIRADEQVAGRGRLGRTWLSAPGNLYATLLFATEAPVNALSQVSFVAAVAMYEAAQSLVGRTGLGLKWPNDCLINGAKFCGILPEVVAPAVLAVGCGVNVLHAPEVPAYPADHLARHRPGLTVDQVFEDFSASLWHWLTIWDHGRGFQVIRQAWLERCIGLGGGVVTEALGPGIFQGLTPDGGLIIERPDGSLGTVHAGDVRFAAIEEMRQKAP